jgi:hypothetical protein
MAVLMIGKTAIESGGDLGTHIQGITAKSASEGEHEARVLSNRKAGLRARLRCVLRCIAFPSLCGSDSNVSNLHCFRGRHPQPSTAFGVSIPYSLGLCITHPIT